MFLLSFQMSEATRTTTLLDHIICTAPWSFIWGVYFMNIYKYFFSRCVFTERNVPVVRGTYGTYDLTSGFSHWFFKCFSSPKWVLGLILSISVTKKTPTYWWGKTTIYKINTFRSILGGSQCYSGKGDRVGAWVACHASTCAFRNTNLKETRCSGGTWDKGFPGCLLLEVSSGIFGRLVYWSYRL